MRNPLPLDVTIVEVFVDAYFDDKDGALFTSAADNIHIGSVDRRAPPVVLRRFNEVALVQLKLEGGSLRGMGFNEKCLRALDVCNGVVREVSDEQILNAKARVGENGLGCEPASAASVAGAKLLRAEGVIAPSERVVCILTGHQLKDPTATVAYHTTDQEEFNRVLGSRGVKRAEFANRAVAVPNDLDEIVRAIQLNS